MVLLNDSCDGCLCTSWTVAESCGTVLFGYIGTFLSWHLGYVAAAVWGSVQSPELQITSPERSLPVNKTQPALNPKP